MSEDPTIPAEYARHIAAQLDSMGVSVDAWLAASGFDADALDAPEALLSTERFCALVLDSLRLSREPALGLFVGKRLVASSHGIVGAVAVNSRTVGQALEMVERFAGLRTSLFRIEHRHDAGRVRVTFSETQALGEVQRPMIEAVMLSIKNVLDDITMGGVQLGVVAFPFAAPDYAALTRDMFGAPVAYGEDWAGFAGDAAMLDIPLRQADPAAFEVAAEICQRELGRLQDSETLATQVRRALLQQQNGFPSLQVTARMFHMTQRTLHRRLVAEGTSYRELLESVRHTLAVEHLKSGRFTLDEIAYRLGYTDLANFRRAFRRWEGVPPTAFRRGLPRAK